MRYLRLPIPADNTPGHLARHLAKRRLRKTRRAAGRGGVSLYARSRAIPEQLHPACGVSKRKLAPYPRGIGQHAAARRPAYSNARATHGAAKHREHSMEGRQTFTRGSETIVAFEVFLFARNTERVQRQAQQTTVFIRGHAPRLAVIGHVDKGMPKRRQFPIEDRNHPRLGCVDHEVAHAIVAVTQGLHGSVGYALREPGDHTVKRGIVVVACSKLRPLLRPTAQLPSKVVARPPIVGQANLVQIETVNSRHGPSHSVVDRPSLVRLEPGRAELIEDPALQALHQIERRAYHLTIRAILQRCGHGDRATVQRAEYAKFAVNGVGRWHQNAAWLLAQHRLPIAPPQIIRWIRHPALRALDSERLGRSAQRLEIFGEARRFEINIAGIGAVRRRHAGARSRKPKRYCATRRIWTSSVPSVMR